MNRTGARLGSEASDAAAATLGVAGDMLRGLHMYDGHAGSLGSTRAEVSEALFPLREPEEEPGSPKSAKSTAQAKNKAAPSKV